MKKIAIVICLIVYTSSVFGQQFLWSTIKDGELKYVPLDRVTSEVLKFYDYYEYYYDGAGYSKASFGSYFEEIGDNTEGWNNFKKMINETDELTVFAFRINLGRGSNVLVLSIDNSNVNIIAFSNSYDRDAIDAESWDRSKFTRWFNSLLDLPSQANDETEILDFGLPAIDDIIGDITDDPIEVEDPGAPMNYGEGEYDSSGGGIFGRKVIYRDPGMVRLVNGKIW